MAKRLWVENMAVRQVVAALALRTAAVNLAAVLSLALLPNSWPGGQPPAQMTQLHGLDAAHGPDLGQFCFKASSVQKVVFFRR